MPLKVLTINIWNCQGPWKKRLSLIRAWIDSLNPDIIGLQEVLVGNSIDQVAMLLPSPNWHTAYVGCKAFNEDPSISFGNALLSRWPIDDQKSLPLISDQWQDQRSALFGSIQTPLGPFEVGCVHLSWQPDQGAVREQQVLQIATHLMIRARKCQSTPILMGDFNASPESTEIRYIKGLQSIQGHSVNLYDVYEAANGSTDSGETLSHINTYAPKLSPLEATMRRVDYIFMGIPNQPMNGPIRCQVVCNEPQDGIWPSDHFGVFASIE